MFFLINLYPEELHNLSYAQARYDELDLEATSKFFEEAELPAGISRRSRKMRALVVAAQQEGRYLLLRTPIFESEDEFDLPEGKDLKAEIVVPHEWVASTGFGHFFLNAANLINALRFSIDQRRHLTNKKLDEVFGLN